MIILFACRRYRLRDLGLLRRGAVAAGHRFRVMELPWAAPLVALAAVLRWCGVSVHLVLSDKVLGDQWLARLFGRHATRMLWNYPDELPAAAAKAPAHKVCFFAEPGMSAELFVFGPQPAAAAAAVRTRAVVFLGDVADELPLARGAAWWRERFEALRVAHGFDFYLHGDCDALIADETDAAQRRLARVLAKNLLRLWIVREARAAFGPRVVLVGSNWRRFGLDSEPSLYSEQGRLDYFRSASVNLDCGSKSGDGVLYPRSSELITYAGGLLQVRCADAQRVFGERAAELCFRDRDSLCTAIERRLAEPETARAERDAWLVARLRDQRWLMQHSVERMVARP